MRGPRMRAGGRVHLYGGVGGAELQSCREGG